MDILYLVGGALFGSIFAGLIGAAVPNMQFQQQVVVTLVGCFFGFGIGFLLMWISKHEQIKQVERQKQRARAKSATPQQIVGKKCAECQASIIFVGDGHICPLCQKVKCKNCEPNVPCRGCENLTFVAEVVED